MLSFWFFYLLNQYWVIKYEIFEKKNVGIVKASVAVVYHTQLQFIEKTFVNQNLSVTRKYTFILPFACKWNVSPHIDFLNPNSATLDYVDIFSQITIFITYYLDIFVFHTRKFHPFFEL